MATPVVSLRFLSRPLPLFSPSDSFARFHDCSVEGTGHIVCRSQCNCYRAKPSSDPSQGNASETLAQKHVPSSSWLFVVSTTRPLSNCSCPWASTPSGQMSATTVRSNTRTMHLCWDPFRFSGFGAARDEASISSVKFQNLGLDDSGLWWNSFDPFFRIHTLRACQNLVGRVMHSESLLKKKPPACSRLWTALPGQAGWDENSMRWLFRNVGTRRLIRSYSDGV